MKSGASFRFLLLLLPLACGDDSGTNSSQDGVKFPNIPSDVLSTMCIRGQIVPPKTLSGTVTDADCQIPGLPDYREGWRVRVKTSADWNIRVTADFYGNLYLFAVNPENVAGMVQLERSSIDGSEGDGLITHTLLSGSENWVYIKNFDYYGGNASYTLSVIQ